MNITIGTGWAILYAILGLIGIIGGAIWLIYNARERESVLGPLAVLVVGIASAYLWSYAATHFRVPVNKQALLINTIDQKVIGTRQSGIQTRPIFGVKVDLWPANNQFDLLVDMGPGVESATTKNGTSIYADTKVYLDLSHMDIEAAFRASNGNWDTFYEKNLRPGLMDVTRNISDGFGTSDHTFKRGEWVTDYEAALQVYFATAGKGYGIVLVPGRTTMSWDFVNEQDAKAYDDANRAGYLTQQRENEKAALLIEAEMAKIRSEMLSSTADGSITGLQKISDFIASQPPELRPYLMEYLKTMVDLEYLRLVGEQRPAQFLPPNSGTVPTYNFNQPLVIPTSLPPATPAPTQ